MARTGNTQAKRRGLFTRKPSRVGSFAMIQPNARIGATALTQVKDGAKKRHVLDQWATEAYNYVDEIGEVGFVMNLQANVGAQCTLDVQEYDPETDEWKDSDDERAIRVMDAFVGPQGGQAELIRRGFLHLGIAGESTLVGTATEEKGVSTGIHWEFLSSEELPFITGTRPRRRPDGGSGTELPDDTYLARMWRSSPRYSELADSPMRRVLSICNEIVTLTQMVSAISRSRLAAGIFYVPEEITFAGTAEQADAEIDVDPDELDADDGTDEFIETLTEHLRAPVEDRTAAAGLVPLVMRGPAEHFKNIGLIEVARNLDTWAQGLRAEALGRLAAGLDIDPAIVEGKKSLNHWTAANVDAELITKQTKPTGELIASFTTVAYLRPMLETFEDMTEDDARSFRCVFNTAPITARTDEAVSARVLHEMDVISDEALVAANGFDAADMPDEEEKIRRMAKKLLMSNPTLGPALGELAGMGKVAWGARASVGLPGKDGAPGGAPASPAGDGPGDLAPPDATSGQETPQTQPSFTALVDRLTVAADAALERAQERAQSRFVTKARNNPDLREKVTAAGKQRALTVVSPSELAMLNIEAADLLSDAWDGLSMKARAFVRAHLEQKGQAGLIADDIAAQTASRLCQRMQGFAERSIHEVVPIQANGLRVPTELVIEALLSTGVS